MRDRKKNVWEETKKKGERKIRSETKALSHPLMEEIRRRSDFRYLNLHIVW